MLIGYARTSTLDQVAGLEAQIEALRLAGCDKLFQEQASSVGHRSQLATAMDFCREGDILIVTKLDRLARSVRHLGEIIDQLGAKSVDLRILNLGLDTSTATGKLMLNVVGAVAQFEREMMLERQREGIAKAKAEGKYRGRFPSAKSKASEMEKLLQLGLTRKQIAERLCISVRSVYRSLNETLPI